jgi:hypothetical protein
VLRRLGVPARLAGALGPPDAGRMLGSRETAAARALARDAYYDELDLAHGAPG